MCSLVGHRDVESAANGIFRYAECAQRCAGRLDFRESMDCAPFSDDTLRYHPLWFPIVQRLLGPDAVLVAQGIVTSYPVETPTDLGWHTDGPHMFEETGVQLPVHCLNVMVPLIDVTKATGPTEYVPGSHTLAGAAQLQASGDNIRGAVHFTENDSMVVAGSATLFDYRTRHRGRANHSQDRRPLLYLTYGRVWLAAQPIVDANFVASRPLISAAERKLIDAEVARKLVLEAARVEAATVSCRCRTRVPAIRQWCGGVAQAHGHLGCLPPKTAVTVVQYRSRDAPEPAY